MSRVQAKKPIDWLNKLGNSSKIPYGMFDIMVATCFINILSLAMPLALLQIYDRILPNSSLTTLTMLLIGIGVALIFEALLKMGRSYLSGWIGARFEHMAGCAAIERVLSTSVNDFEKDGSGVHLERLDSLTTLKEFYAGQAIMTLFDLPFAFLFLMVISYLAGNLVFVPIVIIILFAISAWFIGNKLRKAIHERMEADERRFNFIIEVLGGIHTLKSMAMETQMLRRYERLQESCAKTDFEVTLNSSNAMSAGALFSQITMFTVVGFGATHVIDGALTIGGLAACTMLAGRAMQPLQRAVGIWARFQSIQLARSKMREIFELQPETEGSLPSVKSNFNGNLELRDIELKFGDENAAPLFTNVNLNVKPGEIVGITGGNASGKSSLLYIMMGAMRANQGDVFIEGENINDLDPKSVRQKIAYLPQHGVLFNGTILENLTMFNPYNEDKALKIARILGLDDVVARMPLGYDTQVGNGAYDSLPRGIKQRVAIGRALMSDPVVLLFDEANSAMDSSGDQVLTQFLEDAKGKRTLILVSHRPSLLRMADRIYDLTHNGLVKKELKPFTPPAKTGVPGAAPTAAESPKPTQIESKPVLDKKENETADHADKPPVQQGKEPENLSASPGSGPKVKKPKIQLFQPDEKDQKNVKKPKFVLKKRKADTGEETSKSPSDPSSSPSKGGG